jgi:hypothetical protein
MSKSIFKTKISSGVLFALFSAVLFGASTPLSKNKRAQSTPYCANSRSITAKELK